MSKRLFTIGVVSVLLGAAVQLRAHHSFGAAYLENDMIEVSGSIVEFQYRNPHSWVFVQGRERSGLGEARIYGAEWVSTSQLEHEGIEKNTLHAGDDVRIWGSPSRNLSDAKLHLKGIERKDGWSWHERGQPRK
jgi:Family of unknown function (DUF6152)